MLAVLDRLPFFKIHKGSMDPYKPECWVYLPPRFSSPPEVAQLLESLGLGGNMARCVFRRLDPHQGLLPHTDTWMPQERDWRRFHVPLVSHPDIRMRWPDDGVEVYLEPGYLWEVCFKRKHEVVNPTDSSRTHIQIDQADATI